MPNAVATQREKGWLRRLVLKVWAALMALAVTVSSMGAEIDKRPAPRRPKVSRTRTRRRED